MRACIKCTRTDVKCCYTCKKAGSRCTNWSNCGSDCLDYEAKVPTNVDESEGAT